VESPIDENDDLACKIGFRPKQFWSSTRFFCIREMNFGVFNQDNICPFERKHEDEWADGTGDPIFRETHQTW
jgi:hypothetical protein